jgi:hypothetical protein
MKRQSWLLLQRIHQKQNHFPKTNLSLIDVTTAHLPARRCTYRGPGSCVNNAVRKLTREVRIEYSSILTLVRCFTQFLQSNAGNTSGRHILLPLHSTKSIFSWHRTIRRYSSCPTDGVVKQKTHNTTISYATVWERVVQAVTYRISVQLSFVLWYTDGHEPKTDDWCSHILGKQTVICNKHIRTVS